MSSSGSFRYWILGFPITIQTPMGTTSGVSWWQKGLDLNQKFQCVGGSPLRIGFLGLYFPRLAPPSQWGIEAILGPSRGVLGRILKVWFIGQNHNLRYHWIQKNAFWYILSMIYMRNLPLLLNFFHFFLKNSNLLSKFCWTNFKDLLIASKVG